MKKPAFALAVLVGVAAFWIFTKGSAPGYTNLPPRVGETWVAFGDSLTSGLGAGADQDYPSQLGRRLGVRIHNAGVPGDTTANALRRIDDAIALKPKVVLVCLGGNDSFQKIPLTQIVSNLAEIIDRFHAEGAFVVLIGVRSATLMDEFNAAFNKLAREKRVLFIPNILKGVLGHPDLMSDQIHPNDAGYAKIAERLDRILRPLLPNLQTNTTG